MDIDERLPLKALSIFRSLKPSPTGISIEDLGLVVSHQYAKLTRFAGLALYCVTDNQQGIRCRYADGPLAGLVGGPEIPLGEKLSGWVAAHRTPIWNSDATLDLPADVARAAGIALGSSVPLLDGEVLVGAVTFYSSVGIEIGLEQRVLIQSMAPILATALSSAIAHDEVAAIDGTAPYDREALYTVMDALLSSRARWPDRNHPDRLTIVRVRWQADSTGSKDSALMTQTIERAITAATINAGHVVRLSANDVLVASAQRHLVGAGLAPISQSRTIRRAEIEITEVANSLHLRVLMFVYVKSV
jgi:hypothetical protein